MQNEELQQTRAELEAGLESYTDLYDFAPVGYCEPRPRRDHPQANLTATRLLGRERSWLVPVASGSSSPRST